jgi:glycyl-tRNA synthetase beta chain
MLAKALSLYADLPVASDLGLAADELYDFTQRRLEGWLVDSEGLDLAVVRAVLPVRGSDPADARAWIQALEQFRTREDFLLLATGFKRCTNILKGEVLAADQRDAACQRWLAGGRGAGGEDFTTLSEPAEEALRDAVAAAIADILQAESRGEYRAVFQLLSGLGPTIDRFFDEVRVNAEDPALLALRHAFLREIHALFLRFADFSRVVPEE